MEMLSQKASILPKIVVFEYIEFQNERKIERHSKYFERERERKVFKILSASAHLKKMLLDVTLFCLRMETKYTNRIDPQ